MLVGHANLLDRLSSSVAQFDSILTTSSTKEVYDDYSDSDSDNDSDADENDQETRAFFSSSSDTESESESDSESDYDDSNARSRYYSHLQDVAEESEEVDQNSNSYILSSQPALYKCPSQNLRLSSISLSSYAGQNENQNVTTSTATILSDEESDDEFEEDLGTLSPVYVL